MLKDKSPKANRRIRIDKKVSPGRRISDTAGHKNVFEKNKSRPAVRKRPLGIRVKETVTDGQSPHNGTRKGAGRLEKSLLPAAITPWKVIFASFLIGVCGILYINHLFTTQQILGEVQQLEAEYNKVRRIHADRKLEYDRMVGPKEIYEQARELGFINAGPADQLLILN